MEADTTTEYWNKFYRRFDLESPSSFAEFVSGMISSDDVVVDVGCGNGRDSLFFASQSTVAVVACDSSVSGLEGLQENAVSNGLGDKVKTVLVEFGRSDLSLLIDQIVRAGDSRNLVIYARFFLHAIEEESEVSFWKFTRALHEEFGLETRVFVEYRTLEDREKPKQTPNHFRRFLEPSEVAMRAKSYGSLNEVHTNVGTGFSIFGLDDPVLCRQEFSSVC